MVTPYPYLPCLVDVRYRDRELSYSQNDRQNDSMTERPITLLRQPWRSNNHKESSLSVQCYVMQGQNINLPVCVCVCVSVTLFVNSLTGHTRQRIFFTSSRASAYTDARYWYSRSVRLSVRLYVRDVPVSDENGLTYRHRFYRTVAQSLKFYQH